MCLQCYVPVCLCGVPLTSFLLIMGVGTLATAIAAGYARRGAVKNKANTCCGQQLEPVPSPCQCPRCLNDHQRPIQIILERSNPGHNCQKSILKNKFCNTCNNASQFRTYDAYQVFVRQPAYPVAKSQHPKNQQPKNQQPKNHQAKSQQLKGGEKNDVKGSNPCWLDENAI